MRIRLVNRWKWKKNMILFEASRREYFNRVVYSIYLFGFGVELWK